jgi:hypothetical protein
LSRKVVLRVPESFSTTALFTRDHRYRYELSRVWDKTRPMAFFVGLNPSVADEVVEDRTQIRIRNFARSWGYGGYYMGNIYALVSTDPRRLWRDKDPVGKETDAHLLAMQRRTALTVAAWGCQKPAHDRAKEVAELLGKERRLYALALAADGCPRHALYLKSDHEPVPFRGFGSTCEPDEKSK